jgi:hypothetical protein
MAATLNYTSAFSVDETLSSTPGSAAPTVKHAAFDKTATLYGTTTPPVTKVAFFEVTLSGGAATVNLAALSGTNGTTVDGTGLKVQAIRVENTGANSLTIAPGASNGIDLFGTGSLVIPAGGHVVLYSSDGTPDIASGDRTLDLTGTGSQVSRWSVVMG